MTDLTIEQKMMLSLAGDKRAYESLLLEISSMIKGYLIKKLPCEDDADDVLQDVLYSIHNSRHTYDGKRPLKPWIFAIATYRINDHLRKIYKDVARNSSNFEDLQDMLAGSAHHIEGFGELVDVVGQLPPRQQQIITLMKVEGYSSKEVAKKMDMSVSAVKVSAHRAYKKLKIMIEEMAAKNE